MKDTTATNQLTSFSGPLLAIQKSLRGRRITGVYRMSIGASDYYIGSSSHLAQRLRQHQSNLNSGVHPSRVVQETYDRLERPEILVEVQVYETHGAALLAEQRLLDRYFGNARCLNELGKVALPPSRESRSHGKRRSETSMRHATSPAHLAQLQSQANRAKIADWNSSPGAREHIARLAKAKRGCREFSAKLRIAKQVAIYSVSYSDGRTEVFTSIRHAAERLGLSYSGFRKWLAREKPSDRMKSLGILAITRTDLEQRGAA